MKVAVLTLSDSSFKNNNYDKGGPLLLSLLKNSAKLKCVEIVDYSILPDDEEKIKHYLKKFSMCCDIILTTGGTGLSQRDVTPEATKQVIDRECNGISTALLVRGLQSTPHAALSRLVAGTCGKCLIINLPGSPKAVTESMDVLENILSHAVTIIKGDDEQTAKVHSDMQGTNT